MCKKEMKAKRVCGKYRHRFPGGAWAWAVGKCHIASKWTGKMDCSAYKACLKKNQLIAHNMSGPHFDNSEPPKFEPEP